MREVLAALLTAAVLLPPAAAETTKVQGDARLAETNIVLFNDEAQAESKRRKRFKRWCRRHKKDCKTAYRTNTNQDHFHGDGREQLSRLVITGYTLNGEQTGRRVETIEASNDPQFWSRNGRVPGSKKRRGCGRLTKTSMSQHRRIRTIHHYTISMSKFWCWKKGRVREIDVNTGFPFRNAWVDVKKQRREGDFYRWKAEIRRSGHYTFWYPDMHACLHFVWRYCVANYHPYIRIYSHSDGSYHASGHHK